jgi:3,4-dihydroxy 2-butanone 4-phosphate synthase/GTP cyclohydrolase II
VADRIAPDEARVERAIAALQAGQTVIVGDGENGVVENLGLAVIAAEHADAPALLELSKRAAGWAYLALTDQRCEELGLEVVAARDSLVDAPVTLTIRARDGVTTGISVADRAHTIAVAIDPAMGHKDIRFGGNVMPLRARPGGVLERAGHTEASVDLARFAGLRPAAVIGELLLDDGSEATGPELIAFAERVGWPIVSIGEIIAYRRQRERLVRRIVATSLATQSGIYRAVGYLGAIDDQEHMALVRGDIEGQEDVLVYIHVACWEGDVFHGTRCDCRVRLDAAIAKIAEAGRGVIVHLATKDYMLHERGDADARIRDFGVGAQMLADLGLTTIRVLTDHPRPLVGLEGFGLTITGRAPLTSAATR